MLLQQVYTFDLKPLTGPEPSTSSLAAAAKAQQPAAAERAGSSKRAGSGKAHVSGWELRLVMEFCAEVR